MTQIKIVYATLPDKLTKDGEAHMLYPDAMGEKLIIAGYRPPQEFLHYLGFDQGQDMYQLSNQMFTVFIMEPGIATGGERIFEKTSALMELLKMIGLYLRKGECKTDRVIVMPEILKEDAVKTITEIKSVDILLEEMQKET